MTEKKDKPRAMIGKTPVWCVHDAVVNCVELKPNKKNPNMHPKSQIELLGKIISKQGWRAPITVSNRSGLIVKGHGRLEAAFRAGITKAPIDYQDYASEADELADMAADNIIPEMAFADDDLMNSLVSDLREFEFDVELLGFDQKKMKSLLRKKSAQDNEGEEVLGDVYEYQIIINCDSENHQFKLLEKLRKEGLSCRPLML